MVANSVVPVVGPAGALIGVGVATSLRLILGQVMPDYRANAILFAIAAAGFVLSAAPPADPATAAWPRRCGTDEST